MLKRNQRKPSDFLKKKENEWTPLIGRERPVPAKTRDYLSKIRGRAFIKQREREREREIISSFRNTAEAWTGSLPVHTYSLFLINWAIDVREISIIFRSSIVWGRAGTGEGWRRGTLGSAGFPSEHRRIDAGYPGPRPPRPRWPGRWCCSAATTGSSGTWIQEFSYSSKIWRKKTVVGGVRAMARVR